MNFLAGDGDGASHGSRRDALADPLGLAASDGCHWGSGLNEWVCPLSQDNTQNSVDGDPEQGLHRGHSPVLRRRRCECHMAGRAFASQRTKRAALLAGLTIFGAPITTELSASTLFATGITIGTAASTPEGQELLAKEVCYC